MPKKFLSTILIISGLVLFLISISADVLGIGGDLTAFGWKQIVGAAAGLISLLVGIQLRKYKDHDNK